MTHLDQSDGVEIECQLSIDINGQQEIYAHTYRLTPADLSRDAPERFSEIRVAGRGVEAPGVDIRARARFRRLR